MSERFWETKTLEQMTTEEWEALCDGCALCCLHKLEDEDTGDLYYTRLACRLLDADSGRCGNYGKRFKLVSDCVKVSWQDRDQFHWMPYTCAYRTLAEGRKLEPWHPLNSGDPESVHRAGVSVRGRVISEVGVAEEDWEEHIIHWVHY